MFLPADGNMIIAKEKRPKKWPYNKHEGGNEDQTKNSANSYIRNRHRFLHIDGSLFKR